MGSSFHIHVHPSGDSVHLILEGDLDGLSAYSLLDILKENCRWASRAFIHTSRLNMVQSSARIFLENNLSSVDSKCLPLSFTGEHAKELAPKGSKYP